MDKIGTFKTYGSKKAAIDDIAENHKDSKEFAKRLAEFYKYDICKIDDCIYVYDPLGILD